MGDEHTWIEEIQVMGSDLVERVKQLIREGNVRRLIIRNQNDDVILEIPLNTGVAVGGVLTIFAPAFVALGAMASMLVNVKIQVVRTENRDRQ